jgi:hypothetical protein
MGKPIKHRDGWRIRPIDAEGKRLSFTFATYKEANYELLKYEVETQEVRGGTRRFIHNHKTFDELCDYWIISKAMKRSSSVLFFKTGTDFAS